ncbi:MAG: hypothetical protein LBC19_09705 [Tannerella sp.]|jgi:hypothetical protein|nr:hypothetical protein [Tannerella sp.]
MRKLMFILGFGLMIGMVNVHRAEAQVHVGINIDIQPAWGPSGYNYAEFYYIPELNIYYDVINRLFYYYDKRRWISAPYLPVIYNTYDFYSLYKVVFNNIRYPWKYNLRHRNIYAKYRHNYVQVPIFYMNEGRYHHARSNFYEWVEPRHMPENNGRPHSREFTGNTRNGRIGSDRSSGNSRSVGNRSSETLNSRGNATRSNANGRNENRENPVTTPRSNNDNSRNAVSKGGNNKVESDRTNNNRGGANERAVDSNTSRSERSSSRTESAKKTSRSKENSRSKRD